MQNTASSGRMDFVYLPVTTCNVVERRRTSVEPIITCEGEKVIPSRKDSSLKRKKSPFRVVLQGSQFRPVLYGIFYVLKISSWNWILVPEQETT